MGNSYSDQFITYTQLQMNYRFLVYSVSPVILCYYWTFSFSHYWGIQWLGEIKTLPSIKQMLEIYPNVCFQTRDFHNWFLMGVSFTDKLFVLCQRSRPRLSAYLTRMPSGLLSVWLCLLPGTSSFPRGFVIITTKVHYHPQLPPYNHLLTTRWYKEVNRRFFSPLKMYFKGKIVALDCMWALEIRS